MDVKPKNQKEADNGIFTKIYKRKISSRTCGARYLEVAVIRISIASFFDRLIVQAFKELR
jgi:hypothetical protein